MAEHTIIATTEAPAAIGPYSQAVQSGGVIYVSGQIGFDPATGQIVEGGIQEQSEQALKNLGAILRAAGSDYSHVLKTTVFLADMADFTAMNEVYARYFRENPPARSTVAVKDLPRGAKFEIECIAAQ